MPQTPINSENLSPVAAEIAALDAYKQRLANHDWTYHFSDDPRIYRAGVSEANQILSLARTGSIEFKKAYNDEHKRQFDQPCFTGETEPNKYPWKPPFPEAYDQGTESNTQSGGNGL